jgi:uncharacterized protein (TIGR00255 family)
MIKSMTGFSAATRERELATVSVSVKSVNHRFLDVQFRLPQVTPIAEAALRIIVQKYVARGRVEITAHVQLRRASAPSVEINEAFVAALADAVDRARTRGFVAGSLSPADLLRFPQAITISDQAIVGAPEEETKQVQQLAEEALDQALQELGGMRRREGEFLRDDLESRRHLLVKAIEDVAVAANAGSLTLQARLAERIQEIAGHLSPDPGLIAQEIVRFAARSDISEEIVRFRAHLVHWDELGSGPEPCGRKLDFLLQEMNREINTIGAKAEGLRVSELIVHVKAELERMREQVQNVE